jgi:hypothetical protein
MSVMYTYILILPKLSKSANKKFTYHVVDNIITLLHTLLQGILTYIYYQQQRYIVTQQSQLDIDKHHREHNHTTIAIYRLKYINTRCRLSVADTLILP